MIRVGRRKYIGSKYVDPTFTGFTSILCLTKSSPYGDLGPYVITDENGVIFENKWQFSKVYEKVPASKQTYSRYDNTIIWDHPEETHISEGKITEEYWNWRKKGFECPYPVRYPVGLKGRHTCKYALLELENNLYLELDYIEARKHIYLKDYVNLVKNVEKYRKLKKKLEKGENLLIIEVDGPHEESMPYYKEKYNVPDDFIENETILCTRPNLDILLNDPKHPFGHGYCLAWALLDYDTDF